LAADAPLLVATVGLHASASTWVFNVARELLIAAYGEAAVMTLYADEIALLPTRTARAGRHLVVKSHRGSPPLDRWFVERGARVLVSVRDPRDAAVSMAQRFRRRLGDTVQWLLADCEHVERLEPALLLRYEDRFFDDAATIERIAETLGVPVDPVAREAIFARYTTEAVRELAREVPNLPEERLQMVAGVAMDKVTQILAPHVGDTRVGKWRDVPPMHQAELNRIFAGFIERYGYA